MGLCGVETQVRFGSDNVALLVLPTAPPPEIMLSARKEDRLSPDQSFTTKLCNPRIFMRSEFLNKHEVLHWTSVLCSACEHRFIQNVP
jgi:hypothetical protein